MLFALTVIFHLCSVASPDKCADDTKSFRLRPPNCGSHYTVNTAELAGLAGDQSLTGPTNVDVTCK